MSSISLNPDGRQRPALDYRKHNRSGLPGQPGPAEIVNRGVSVFRAVITNQILIRSFITTSLRSRAQSTSATEIFTLRFKRPAAATPSLVAAAG